MALAFAVMSSMTGKKLQDKMTQYQNALADMSNEAVEYVRGIPVVKTFGQTVFSFKKFKGTCLLYTSYLSWVLSAAGALLALVPFWYIWRILGEVIEVAPQYGNAVHVTHLSLIHIWAEGERKGRAFLGGVLSGVVEPIGAVLTILAAQLVIPALP